MDRSPQSSHTPQGQSNAGTHQISCTNCRKRKIKCNRVEPCGPCARAGTECIFRARAPRSQRKVKDTKSRETELLLRLSRLEGLVSKIDPAAIREAYGSNDDMSLSPPVEEEINFAESPMIAEVPADGMKIDRMDGVFSDFVKQQEHWTRHTNSAFWKNLSEEINGLRQILEDPMDDRDDEDDLTESTPPKHSPPYLLFGDFDPQNMYSEVPYPSNRHRTILFEYYFSNIDPIYKLLHRPTANKFLTSSEDLIDEPSGRYKFMSLEAVTFAMYFTTVATLSPDQCLQHFNESKNALLERYRRGAEVALLRDDFMNSMNIVVLNAFLIYIIGLRVSRDNQSCWSFIGLAIRIAQNIGIHRDGDGSSLTPHEAEQRRRVWWHILSMDMKASEDRGCEPMLSECCFNTRLPSNLDDDDYSKYSLQPPNEKKGITKVTAALMTIEVARTVQKLHFVPPKHSTAILTFEEKTNLANECIKKIDSYFVNGYDQTNPYHLLVCTLSRIHMLRLRLVVLYPMQRISRTPEIQPRTSGLKYVVELLSIADSLETSDYAKNFEWHFSTSVSWHPVAVALAELCAETSGPLADEAWRLIDKHWPKWGIWKTGSQEEKMWRPVKRLLRRAREARQRSQPQAEQLQALSLSESNGVPSSSSIVEKQELVDCGSSATIIDNNVALDFPSQVNGVLDPYQWGFNNITYPSMNMTADATMPMNWDEWNAFIYDAGNLNPNGYAPYPTTSDGPSDLYQAF